MQKLHMILIFLFCHFALNGQKESDIKLTFNHLSLSVKDLNQSVQFYEDLLGLKEITNRTQMEGIRWFSLGEGKELHLISIIKEPVMINKAVHFALTTKNMNTLIEKLKVNKIEYSDWLGKPNTINIRPDGIQQIYFKDPDGYWIEVNSVPN